MVSMFTIKGNGLEGCSSLFLVKITIKYIVQMHTNLFLKMRSDIKLELLT